ncbi:hypothetical protein ACOMHN_061490 [Nucella lapillus]
MSQLSALWLHTTDVTALCSMAPSHRCHSSLLYGSTPQMSQLSALWLHPQMSQISALWLHPTDVTALCSMAPPTDVTALCSMAPSHRCHSSLLYGSTHRCHSSLLYGSTHICHSSLLYGSTHRCHSSLLYGSNPQMSQLSALSAMMKDEIPTGCIGIKSEATTTEPSPSSKARQPASQPAASHSGPGSSGLPCMDNNDDEDDDCPLTLTLALPSHKPLAAHCIPSRRLRLLQTKPEAAPNKA